MTPVPKTSVSLLKDISDGTASVRWTEFYRRYEPAMRGFLRERFPSAEADDVIQETLLALMKAMPEYHYTPDSKGHFHNYLMGIVKHKALDAIRRNALLSSLRSGIAQEEGLRTVVTEEDDSWKMAAMEAAMEQLMSDDSIAASTREVFRHVALMNESPEDVARQFGITRNNVDQIKSRMIGRLSALVSSMTA